MTLVDWIGLALLGGVGAVLRYAVDDWVDRRFTTLFPLGTFSINVVGSFALGLLTGAHPASDVLFLVGTGLIGSFTTFSTWIFESTAARRARRSRGRVVEHRRDRRRRPGSRRSGLGARRARLTQTGQTGHESICRGRCQAPSRGRDKLPTEAGSALAKRHECAPIRLGTRRILTRRPEPRPVPGTVTGA